MVVTKVQKLPVTCIGCSRVWWDGEYYHIFCNMYNDIYKQEKGVNNVKDDTERAMV